MTIKVANVIEEGRLGGPQIRISEVALIEGQSQEDVKNQECGNGRLSNSVTQQKFIETTVVFPVEDGDRFKERLDRYNVSYKQLPLNRLTKEKKLLVRYILFFPYEIMLLYIFFKKHQFDIVHVSGGSWQYKGAIAGWLAGCKVLWHLNDTKMPGFIRAFFRPCANKFAHGFIVAAERVRKYYIKELKIGKNKPVFEIQAPVDCSFFNPDEVEPDSRISSCNGINIVTVANINPVKGVEYFLRMAGELNKEYSNLNFWIVGPLYDSQKAYYTKLIDLQRKTGLDNCFFYGSCSDVRRVLKSAGIYVCSSVAEASPLSVWEAMAMEIPVVSTDVGDVSRFIKNGYNGYIAKIKNEYSLAGNVSKLINNCEESKVFGKRSREIVLKSFDTPIIAKKHVQAYTYIYNLKRL
jgi:glycosyltransferase involved in cell wall biosynthesis